MVVRKCDSIYGLGGNLCLDTSVYTESGEGYVLNAALTQELNEKYHCYSAREYHFREILKDVGL